MISKKEYERKLREEQEATAHVFQDFISTFQDPVGPPQKTFLKSGTLYPERGKQSPEKLEIYNPKPLIQTKGSIVKNAIECARILKQNKIEKSKKTAKPTSNLELLKEELKQRHIERDEKYKIKEETLAPFSSSGILNETEGDPNSTNLFVSNLNQKVTETELMKLFGYYGPLASVKIMWPRGEEKFRNTNCGFVAYMSRLDAERALTNFKNRDDFRIGWGKAVDLPLHPIYIPETLLKLFAPPPYTGLPFNAQPVDPNYTIPQNVDDMDKLLKKSTVRVTIPVDKRVLMTVHRVIEFVIREGPLFEAYLMNKEINNPEYNFLFDYKSHVHVYYRWKLYSIKMGQNVKDWPRTPFRMYKGGSIWIPPIPRAYTSGMPKELINDSNTSEYSELSNAQTSRLINMIRNLTLSRHKIADVMVFCLKHSSAMNVIFATILDSLKNSSTSPVKKITRLYLLSDILYNCNTKKIKLSKLDNQDEFAMIIQSMKDTYKLLKTKCDRNEFKLRVLKVVRSWDVWQLFPTNSIRKMESTFLEGSTCDLEEGNSSNDEPLDGASLIKRSLKNNNIDIINPNQTAKVEHDKLNNTVLQGFVPSKWDVVDPEEVEAQAMSTQKLYELELQKNLHIYEEKHDKKRKHKRKRKDKDHVSIVSSKWDSDEEGDFKVTDVEKKSENKHLRKLNYLVRKYKEDLENAVRDRKKGYTIPEQVERYKRHLIKDLENYV